MLFAVFFWDFSFVPQKPAIPTFLREMLWPRNDQAPNFLLDLASKLVIKGKVVVVVNEDPPVKLLRYSFIHLSIHQAFTEFLSCARAPWPQGIR